MSALYSGGLPNSVCIVRTRVRIRGSVAVLIYGTGTTWLSAAFNTGQAALCPCSARLRIANAGVHLYCLKGQFRWGGAVKNVRSWQASLLEREGPIGHMMLGRGIGKF